MQRLDGGWVYSATDLVARMECDHRTALDLADKADLLVGITPGETPGMLAVASEHGKQHERHILTDLKRKHPTVVEIASPANSRAAYAAAAAQTAAALADGADVIYQACFFDGTFVGFADFVIRGEAGYEVHDAKLARRAKPAALLQVAAYSEQLARLGHPMPQQMHVLLGDGATSSHAVDDVLPRLRQIRADLEHQMARGPQVPARIWGDRRPACGSCRWAEICEQGRDDDRDLSLVAGIRAEQRRKLLERGLTTLERLATAGDDKCPTGMGEAAFQGLRAQAALQARQDATRTPDRPDGEVFAEYFSPDGLGLLPAPSQGDVWFDMEGHPFAETGAGLEYLFGYVTIDGSSEDEPEFTPLWAHSREAEKVAFERFVDDVQERIRRWPDLHIYHYADYERAALRRLAGRHGTCEEEIDQWLRGDRLVDLMKVFKRSFRVSQRSYSIKKLEPLYGLVRTEDIKTAGDSVVDYEAYLDLTEAGDPAAARKKLDAIASYNATDCWSTLRLDRWIRGQQESRPDSSAGGPEPDGGLSDDDLRDGEDDAHDRLLDGVPDTGRTALQQARAMMRAAVSYHRRESRPRWWEHYHRLDAPAGDWLTDWEVLAVATGQPGPWEPKRTRAHRALELTIADSGIVEYRAGDEVCLVYDRPTESMGTGMTGGRGWTDAEVVSHVGDSLAVKESTSIDDQHSKLPSAVLPFPAVRDQCLVASSRRFGDAWLDALPAAPTNAVTDLLLRSSPRLVSGGDLPRSGDAVAEVELAVRHLDNSYLAVQGPPGSGKTHLAATVLTSLVASGWRVGVVAQSHKAIENVLDKALECGLPSEQIGKEPRSKTLASKPYHRRKVDSWLTQQPGGVVIGGTAWQFCRAGMLAQPPLDLLVIDEAGQYSLGQTVPLWRAARNILLLGDPQQLPQVSQGTHPEPVYLAALDWLAGGEPVLPERFGYFLDRTWRMSEELTTVVSRLSYARRLRAHDDVKRRRLVDVDPGVHSVPVQHSDRTVWAPEEIDQVVDLVRQHVGRAWNDAGRTRPLDETDLLVVAPFNAQVDATRKALRDAGHPNVPVGTVDRFQGQEAPVVIVSMTASSRDDVPRGLGFVLSRNRLNVAISRAQWASYVVHSPALGDHSPGSAEELVLLGAYLGVVG